MSELGDLLVLLHGADAPFVTVRATYRVWRHDERATAAFAAQAKEQRGSLVQAVMEGDEPSGVESAEVLRIWRRGDRVREERQDRQRNRSYGIRVGDVWWRWDDRLGASSNEDDRDVGSGIGEQLSMLFAPSRVLGALRFDVAGSGMRAGRVTITAEAAPRPGCDRMPVSFELHRLGSGADRYTLEVDAERGVLLAVVAMRDGEPFQEVAATEIAFDEPIEDEVFVFRPPAGEEVRSVSDRVRPEHVPLTEAQQRAPFTVLMPSRVPADWQMHCVYIEPSQRPPSPPSVALQYRSESAHESLHISQQSAASRDLVFDELTGGPGWEQVVREGTVIHVAKGGHQAQAHLEQAGTFVFLMSETLTTEQLATISAALVPRQAQPTSKCPAGRHPIAPGPVGASSKRPIVLETSTNSSLRPFRSWSNGYRAGIPRFRFG